MHLARLLSLFVLVALTLAGRDAGAQRLAELSHAVGRLPAPPGDDGGGRPLGWPPPPQRAESTDRAAHVRRGVVWGLSIYALLAAGYVAHEKATCHGPECFGEGFAWIGLAAGVPIAAGVGAGVGALWPAAASARARP